MEAMTMCIPFTVPHYLRPVIHDFCCDSRRPEFLGYVDGPGHGHLANTYDQEVTRAY